MAGTALIWDLDGTLLDSYGVIASSLRETLAEAGVLMEEAEVLRRARSGSVSEVLTEAAERSGLSYDRLKARYSALSGSRILEIRPMRHAAEILEQAAARGAVHFVYTHRGSTTAPVLEHLNLRRFFKEVVTSASGFPRKPAPDALLDLMERHQLDPGRTFYVGDRTIDVSCARNAGVGSVLYDPSGLGTADRVVRDLLDILEILGPGDASGEAFPAKRREAAVRLWFGMWLKKEDQGILELFARDAVYIESWGPAYRGSEKIKHWFDEWNTRGTVVRWDIRQFFHSGDQTAVQWYFQNQMDGGRVEAFDGMSLIRWDGQGRIAFLQEFGCNEDRYDPYEKGPVPRFREGPALWF